MIKSAKFVMLLLAGLLLGQYGPRFAHAVSGYLASGVNFDSAATALTVIYRNADGFFSVPHPAAETVTAGMTITADACGGVKRITAPTARTTDTTNTFSASTGVITGCVMDVINVSTVSITLDTNLQNNLAGAADVVLGASDTVRMYSSGTAWYQIGDTGNN